MAIKKIALLLILSFPIFGAEKKPPTKSCNKPTSTINCRIANDTSTDPLKQSVIKIQIIELKGEEEPLVATISSTYDTGQLIHQITAENTTDTFIPMPQITPSHPEHKTFFEAMLEVAKSNPRKQVYLQLSPLGRKGLPHIVKVSHDQLQKALNHIPSEQPHDLDQKPREKTQKEPKTNPSNSPIFTYPHQDVDSFMRSHDNNAQTIDDFLKTLPASQRKEHAKQMEQQYFSGLKKENSDAKKEFFSHLSQNWQTKLKALDFTDEKAQQELAKEFAYMFFDYEKSSLNLNYDEFRNQLVIGIRQLDHRSEGENRSNTAKTNASLADASLTKKFNEIADKANLFMEEDRKFREQIAATIKKINEENQQRLKADITEIFVIPTGQIATTLISNELGMIVASSIISLFDGPAAEKKLAQLEKNIAQQEKALKDNNEEDQAKKDNEKIFRVVKKNQQILDDLTNKPIAKEELLKKFKDLNERK